MNFLDTCQLFFFFSKIVMDSSKSSNLAFYIWLFMFYMRIVFLKYFQKSDTTRVLSRLQCPFRKKKLFCTKQFGKMNHNFVNHFVCCTMMAAFFVNTGQTFFQKVRTIILQCFITLQNFQECTFNIFQQKFHEINISEYLDTKSG